MHNLNKKVTLKEIFTGSTGGMYEDGGELDYYKKNGYITDPLINDSKDLLYYITENVQKAWNEFSKAHKIEPKGIIEVSERSNDKKYLDLHGLPITGADLGVFKHALKQANLIFFSGREIKYTREEKTFMFQPRIWTTLVIAYESIDRGTNGVDYVIENRPNGGTSSSCNYHILDKKWYTDSEWFKKYPHKED